MNKDQTETNDPEISTETIIVYHYKGYKYRSLADAESYAKLDRAKPEPDPTPED